MLATKTKTSILMAVALCGSAALSGCAMTQQAQQIRMSEPARELRVDTGSGAVMGAIEDGVASWKGIPFAAPPVGELRWRAPQPAQAWQGVRSASDYGSDCMQEPFPSDAAPLGTPPAEDCLYLNIWKPANAPTDGQDPSRGRPVIFWIYGGGFVNGGASPPTYSGANLASDGVIFVSANYRVGRFGTFAHPRLTAEDPDDGLLGNYGFLDQLAALRWVQDNIAAFGGDPDNVTIVGESAGGMSVHNLVTTPLARGLFAKAVVMSGADGKSVVPGGLAEAERIGIDFAQAKGIDRQDPDAIRKLRAMSAEEITDGLNLMAMFRGGGKTYARPFVDGTIAVDLGEAYSSGDFARVPMIIGATSADMGGKTGIMVAGARSAAARIADTGVPVWHYRFSYVAQSLNQTGAQHASDIPFFFDTQAVKYGDATTARDNAMGRTISDYLVQFARFGDPNAPGLPQWPRYNAASDIVMDFSADGTAVAQRDPWGADIDAAARQAKPDR